MGMAEVHRKTTKKRCPVCKTKFPQRKDGRPKTCSRPCARRLDAVRNGGHSHNWKGGRWIINTGYAKIWMPDHHRADKRGYVLEHLVVMERKLGRPLVKGERVHHKNGVRDDNRRSNLELWFIKKDPSGQRVTDLIKYVAEFHRDAIERQLARV